MNKKVEKAIALMRANLQNRQRVSVGRIAEAVNLSSSRLRHLIKAATGMTVTQHIKLLKIKEARHLLETTYLTVKQIMVEVGSQDESHFVRDFKKICGTTPGRYREGYLERGRVGDERVPTHRTTAAKSGHK